MQEPEEITIGNELIAIYIGAKKTMYGRYMLDDESGLIFEPNQLMYDRSWDWLMLVVNKIEDESKVPMSIIIKVNKVDIIYKWFVIFYPNRASVDYIGGAFVSSSSESKIEAVWKAVVKYINWYNKNIGRSNP